MSRRLYKSSTDKVLAGVCGGIGEYFEVDPVIIRILWVVSAVFGGIGVLAYIVAAIIMPTKEELVRQAAGEATYRRTDAAGAGVEDRRGRAAVPAGGRPRREGGALLGLLLIGLGAFFMLREFLPWVSGGLVAAALFIGLGIFMIVRGTDTAR